MQAVIRIVPLVLLAALAGAAAGDFVGEAFTYQGRLRQAGEAYDGPADLVFRLFDAAVDGNEMATAVVVPAHPVVAGLFTIIGADGATLGSIQGDGAGGVELAGPGNDYAEFLPALDPNETFEPGDVVGVFAGRISKRTAGAQQVMVISTQPIVVGNRPREDDDGLAGLEKVAFVGQAPVRVRGPVDAGDFIVASGGGDGTAVAVPPAALTATHLGRLVGTAWSSSSGSGVTRVVVAIGIDHAHPAARALHRLVAQLAVQASEIDDLRDRLAAQTSEIDEVRSRLAVMETVAAER